MPETCVCCGAVIPEGRQVCTACEKKAYYIYEPKIDIRPEECGLQLFLYNLLNKGKLQ